ncbi:hypothetical protein OS493_010172 [Desmophyllum pertusum]|uniref:Uncharacterized protein n=1 Tax=Desmophyllum pertusum TaxID=174260 RepID=A0A9X0CHY3_9CNID|nr:hypothetical protein OS493_010172 [Desmophyllum pertusum]
MDVDSKKSQQKPFSFKNLPHLMMDSFHRLRTGVQRFIGAILAMISSVTNFFMGIFTAVTSAYEQVAMLIFSMVDRVRQIFHYNYAGYFSRLLTLPRNITQNAKNKRGKYVWMPVADAFTRKVNRISRAFKRGLRESAVYVRGFCEICRRLFVLTSDYTPGGKYTVTAFLAVVAIIFFLKILTVVRVLFQLLELAYSIAAFLLHPLWLTLRDILSIFDPMFQVIIFLVRTIAQAVISTFKAIGIFIWLNLIAIASGLYRCWQGFENSTIVRWIWGLLAKIVYVLLENFAFVFLPFMTKITYYAAARSLDISSVAYSWFYPWFIRGFVEVSVNVDRIEYLTPSGIGSSLFISWALLLAFRYRNRLSGTFFSEIDGKQCTIRSSNVNDTQRERTPITRTTTQYDSSRRKTTNDELSLRNRGKATRKDEKEHRADDATEGHIHYSSQVHICTITLPGFVSKEASGQLSGHTVAVVQESGERRLGQVRCRERIRSQAGRPRICFSSKGRELQFYERRSRVSLAILHESHVRKVFQTILQEIRPAPARICITFTYQPQSWGTATITIQQFAASQQPNASQNPMSPSNPMPPSNPPPPSNRMPPSKPMPPRNQLPPRNTMPPSKPMSPSNPPPPMVSNPSSSSQQPQGGCT